MDKNTKHIIASNLTGAFYAATQRREPYLGEEHRKMPHPPDEDNRVPSLSIDEVYYTYSRFLAKLDESEQEKTN